MLPKGLGNLSGLVRQAMNMKSKIEELKETLGQESVTATAGGGMVTAVINGKFEVLSIKIEPDVLEEGVEAVETLTRAAINEGVRQVQELVQAKMRELTGGMEIPGLL